MIPRAVSTKIESALARQAAVALIGPRQVGKTTLALSIANKDNALYLDLESSVDRKKLSEPRLFLSRNEDKLVVLDEIHRVPELVQELRGLIDEGRRHGRRTGRFLILGSASLDLLRQSGESLAGRISYIEMTPLTVQEVPRTNNKLFDLWLRGGFPDSYLAASDRDSLDWRKDFIRTYLERDIPQFGPRIPAETLERLWTMLAFNQGSLLNASRLAAALSISAQSVIRYTDLFVDLLLVRSLPPFYKNLNKRLVKSPKVYVRDSGIAHALLDLPDYNTLSGHSVIGASWEGFAIENLLSSMPPNTKASFFRTAAGAEIDLVLETTRHGLWAIELKSGLTPKLERGFYHACADLKPKRKYIVYPGEDSYPLENDLEVVSLSGLCDILSALS
jgi:predicted AAA+ superfamily ATPase